MSLNRAMVIGNLGADPEFTSLPTGRLVISFSVATSDSYVDRNGQKRSRVEWHRVVAFGKLADTCHQYLKKGRQVYVEGRLRTREFQAQDDNVKRQRTEILASRVQFLGARAATLTDASTDADPAEVAE